MRLSAKTEYAAIAVLELARQWTSGEPVSLATVAYSLMSAVLRSAEIDIAVPFR